MIGRFGRVTAALVACLFTIASALAQGQNGGPGPPPSNVTIPVTPPNGGTGLTNVTAHGVVIGEGGAPFATATPCAGGLLAWLSTSADPTCTLTLPGVYSFTGAVTFTQAFALPNGSTATTQAAGNNSLDVATTAYADRAFTATTPGAAPASGGGTSNYLRADGSWAAPSGSGSAGEVLLCTLTFTLVTSEAFSTSSSPSCAVGTTYTAYHMHGDGVAGGGFGIRLQDAGQSACDTATDYEISGNYTTAGGGSGFLSGTGETSMLVSSFAGDASNYTDFDVYVTNTQGPTAPAPVNVASFPKMHYVSAGVNASNLYFQRGVGLWNTGTGGTGGVVSICLVSNGGNMTGTVTLYGLTH